jgi:hypothetical protein
MKVGPHRGGSISLEPLRVPHSSPLSWPRSSAVRAPLAAPASHIEYKESTSLADMIREGLVAERIAVVTYHEIGTYFGQDDPTSRTMMEVILRTR